MHRHLICLLLIASLIACASQGVPLVPPLSEGGVVRIKQPFTDIANGGHLDFQLGQLVAPGNLDRWSTWCRLYVYDHTRDADYHVTLAPGDFSVGTVRIGYRSSDFPNWSIHGIGFFTRGVRDLPAYYLYQVSIPLTSPEQPELRSLDCYRKWATPRANQYPTLTEIRTALGEYVELIQAAIADAKAMPLAGTMPSNHQNFCKKRPVGGGIVIYNEIYVALELRSSLYPVEASIIKLPL